MARSAPESGSLTPRVLTFTERARRSQLIEVTIEQVADHGYSGASLARIAEAAGISKAAVLYHFSSKDALVRTAHEHVLSALTDEVAAAIEAAGTAQAPAAYIRSMIGHLREHPRHTRMIVEAMTHDGQAQNPEARWRPLADLLGAARKGGDAPASELRTTAIIVGGAIDAIVAEQLADPDYDTAAAAEQLIDMLYRTLQ